MNAALQNLQFLRPEWFYAFIPLVLFIAYALRRKGTSASWQAVCDAALLPHVLSGEMHSRSRWPLLLIALAGSLSIIAMAGPVLHKLAQPVFRETSSLVIALDVSESMNATDIKPSRLERAKLKLLDILKQRKGGQTALIVYAADAFTVTPLTDDTATIANLVPALDPSLMPAQGSRAERAVKNALDLLQQSGAVDGDILLMTDGIRASDLDTIEPLPSHHVRLSMLGFGTTAGGPIPLEGGFLQDHNGNIVVPKLEPELMRSAAKLGGGLYLNMQADDTDITQLGKLFNSVSARKNSEATDLTADIWREEGPWLLLLVIPLAALGARRGWLASVLLIAFIPVPQPAYADNALVDNLKLDPQYLWLTPDQKAARELEHGDAKSAADKFTRPDWKAAAQYRAGNYEQALQHIDQPKTSDEYYNRGNALAQLQRYQEAIAAYDEALKLSPGQDDAKYNRELVKKELEKQQQQNQQQQDQDQQQDQSQDDQKQNDQSRDSQQQDQNQDSQQNQQQDQQNQDQQQSGQDKQDSQQSDEQQSQQQNEQQQEQQMPETEKEKENLRAEQDKKDQEQKDREAQDVQQQMQADYKENAEAREDDQATEQWLRRIPDDPGGLLRRKFIYQYRRLPNQVEDENPW